MTKTEALALLQKIKQSSKEMISGNVEENQNDEKTIEETIEKQETII
ncbi:hypothetical protein [Anaerophilus nitritogenes]|nr:hypothetical protein [Anaerophilus nitritogenes]